MKRITYLKTLLVGLCAMAATSVWADGNKRVLNSQNYETATASDWTCPNGNAVLKTGDATYGNYAQCTPSGSGNRSSYKSVTFGYEAGSGYTTADMATAGYNIELDFALAGGNIVERSQSQFIVPTTGPNLATNATYTGTDYIFSLSQPSLAATGANEGKVGGNTGTAVTAWFINDLANTSGSTIELDGGTWYHLKLVVTASSVAYTITNNSTSEAVTSGSKTVTALPTITGFFGLLGRGSGAISFDNLEIYDYTENISVSSPTFTFKKVDGANRVYTLTNTQGNGSTLYYTTSPVDEAPAVGDAAYTSTTDVNKDISFSESGKYYAYVLHSNGTTASAIVTQEVTAGALTLAAPVFTVVGMEKAEDDYYYPVISFTSDNSSLEGKPTATFDVTSPYTFTGKGSVTVTASAEGYTSNSSTFEVTNSYVLTKTIDFGAMTADDFDANVWETATGAPRDYWTQRAAAIPADVTYYKLTNTSATAGDPDNSAVLDGITISNYYQRAPEVYIGYGLLTPYTQLSGNGNNMNFTVNGGSATDYIVYNGWNNYGSGTFNTILAGNATFGLYRYDTMLRTIKVYSPSTTTATIGSNGYATFASPYNVKLPSGVTAYTAKVSGDYVNFTKVEGSEIPANTGVLLEGTGEITLDVIATAAALGANDFKVNTSGATFTAAENTTYFAMVKNSDPLTFGTVNPATVAIPANKAYLAVANANNARLTVSFDGGETTGIKAVENAEAGKAIYNLNGQRVEKAQKGLYIVNGKKTIVK